MGNRMGIFSRMAADMADDIYQATGEEIELDFDNAIMPQENEFDAELDREELEALELHAERWDLERGGYL